MKKIAFLNLCAQLSVALLIAGLAGCGGGAGSAPEQNAKTPAVQGVTPDYAVLAVSTTFTVTGQNLPPTAAATIGDSPCATPTSRTATSITVACTPSGQFGNQMLTIRTDTAANGGWWIGQQMIWVSATTPNPAKTPIVTSIAPAAATLGVATPFVVAGLDLPPTASATLGNVACVSGTDRTPSTFTVVCTPAGAAGGQMLTVRTDTESNGGWWLGQQSVWVSAASAPAPVNTPTVSAITPVAAILGAPTTFTVVGQNLPLTASATIGDVNCATPVNRTATGFLVDCTPAGAAGNQMMTIRTDTLINGGWWIGQQMIAVAAK